jgi:hypothetical protein
MAGFKKVIMKIFMEENCLRLFDEIIPSFA